MVFEFRGPLGSENGFRLGRLEAVRGCLGGPRDISQPSCATVTPLEAVWAALLGPSWAPCGA
eukprot:8586675-Pyramimonas_sp.AAC.1